ncbi:tyrosine-type recombinase/integrase [Pseudomonas proteolytica]|uniref:Tyrosine-type recombinase/integrase n=1 Tax=Pseudomonas proteolytica TaxID=219574 RepID=A0AAW4ZW56_9PSED|nr:site-specific integrase [Pseudomonas proteolytica]MCF5056754.1 tyrosine-type recombinase/integrase [Pseudomonas proteolytica]MCF5104951.1 tyrosine-type recombinase/integrase [Pseudomonas proteolytica]
MARKPMGLPSGMDIHHGSIRIRFMLNGRRRSETLPYPPTQKGIKSASQVSDQVNGLIKLGLLDDDKYAELFPNSSNIIGGKINFGEYAQLWLDSRAVVGGTKVNYTGALNLYWMPTLALVRIDLITTTLLRRTMATIKWTSPAVKRNAIVKLSTILKSAVAEELIPKNPAGILELPKRSKKEIDPFTLDEANTIIEKMYQHDHWPSTIYAAFFEFVFFTGMRLSEALALRWDAVDLEKKTAHVCRGIALGEVVERTKTGGERVVLLNVRALHALEFARAYAERRKKGKGKVLETPFIFPPSKNSEYVKQTSDLHKQWIPTLKALNIRRRPPYNCRHTYATICIMSGMNPAFISQQLGHSVQMLLSTYARWINSSSDWSELEKLQIGPKLVPAQISALQAIDR